MRFLVALLFTFGLSAQMRDLPTLSEPRIITTSFEDGLWHHKNGVPRDNTGDGQVGVVVDGDSLRWALMMRMGGGSWPGGAFWTKPYGEDSKPYENWGGNVQEQTKETKSLPGLFPYSHGNIDTHHWVQNPYTKVVTWLAGVKPGYRAQWAKINPTIEEPLNVAGLVFSIQRSTSSVFAAEPENYTRYPNELFLTPHPDAPWEHPVYYKGSNSYWGGVAEGAVLYDPFLDVIVGFYTAKTREAPDAFGQRHRSRIGRYACFLKDFDTNPVAYRLPPPGPESYVWDPIRDGAGGAYGNTNETAIWGTDNGILQMNVFMNPYDGIYHLLCWQRKPSTKGGEKNRSVGLAHYWSANQGLNWVPDTGNPIFTRQSLGWPDIGVANQMNSPNGYIDPRTRKGYIFMWGNEIDRVNKVGTRLYCFEFKVN